MHDNTTDILGGEINNALAIQEINLPTNRVVFDSENEMKSHPKAVIGENRIIVFFLPSQPETMPPIGAKIEAQKKSKEANHDCSVVSRSR